MIYWFSFLFQFVIVIYEIPFFVSALISWSIRSMISNSVHEEPTELNCHSSSPVNVCPPVSLPASKDDGHQDSAVDKVR